MNPKVNLYQPLEANASGPAPVVIRTVITNASEM